MTNMTDYQKLIIAGSVLILVSVVGLAICQVWGVEGADPCEIDAPMERAQCRAQGMRARGMFEVTK